RTQRSDWPHEGSFVAIHHANHPDGLPDETFRLLVERAADGIFIATDEGRFVEVNPSGHRLLGYEPRELIGKTIADVVPPRERARLGPARVGTGSGPIRQAYTHL